jgi:hypothetical protein
VRLSNLFISSNASSLFLHSRLNYSAYVDSYPSILEYTPAELGTLGIKGECPFSWFIWPNKRSDYGIYFMRESVKFTSSYIVTMHPNIDFDVYWVTVPHTHTSHSRLASQRVQIQPTYFPFSLSTLLFKLHMSIMPWYAHPLSWRY